METLDVIDPSYKYIVEESRTILLPLSEVDADLERKKGRMISYPHEKLTTPHLIIKEFTISFENLEGDLLEIKDHLVELYGDKITRITISEDYYLNQVS